MSLRWALPAFILTALTGCGGEPEAAWAVDPIWVEPTEQGMHGFQTWRVFEAKWEKKQRDNAFICAVLVELEGPPTECTDCQLAWLTTATVVDSDCSPAMASNPTWTSLVRLSLGLEISQNATHLGFTSQGFADYGGGWEIHGQAWPAGLDHGKSPATGEWDGAEPFTFDPELAWPLAP